MKNLLYYTDATNQIIFAVKVARIKNLIIDLDL